ncbi:MAG: 4-(cytidine 5'-diphospho)-2-C-methyl-D-erythritol kinase, partial [Candidatus Cloacimonetes bacterium]|nr:4-(cytidine 5'-diphospho)-2-C-methyl-D-erythritol kinase [Candidatus Cloacimonadota bacterium]
MDSGFHSLWTVFSEINLYDILKFSLTKNGDLKILSSLESLNNKDNLIYQVAIYIQAKYSVQYGVKIELNKNIPVAAGLGGGSSNAATTIKGLSRLWNLDLSIGEMQDIASRFGSDINFFLEGYTAIGTNRGEVIQPLDSDLFFDNILLVNPGYPIASREAYQSIDPLHFDRMCDLTPGEQLLAKQDAEFCFNRLEAGILAKYPDLQQTKELLHKIGAKKTLLSGSGPTMIAFFDDPKICQKAREYTEQR